MMFATMIEGRAVMDIVVWLRSLGLGKYEAAFRAHFASFRCRGEIRSLCERSGHEPEARLATRS